MATYGIYATLALVCWDSSSFSFLDFIRLQFDDDFYDCFCPRLFDPVLISSAVVQQ